MNTSVSKEEVEVLVGCHLKNGRFKRHEPKGLVKQHADQLIITWNYTHDHWEEEEKLRRAMSWEEIQIKFAQGVSPFTEDQEDLEEKNS